MKALLHRFPNTGLAALPGLFLCLGLVLSGCAATPQSRSTGETIDDTAVAARVKTALLADPLTDGIDIEIEVDRGLVQLNGFADSAEEVAQATTVAEGVSGVSGVVNNLEIAEGSRKFGEYVDDKVLVARVKGALARDPLVNSLSIEVEVNRRVVMLGGFVQTEEQKAAAGAAAKRVSGIAEVVNRVAVRRSER